MAAAAPKMSEPKDYKLIVEKDVPNAVGVG